MNIVFLDKCTVTLKDDIDLSSLESLGELKTFENSTEAEAIDRGEDAEVLITNKVPITRNVLTALPKLKLVCIIATGYNNIDLEAAKEKGICVCNVPGYATKSVVQHTFALILNLACKVHLYNKDVKAGQWQNAYSFTLLTYPTFELADKTIGIIGFGTIGKEVARVAESFGMKVLAYKPSGIKDDTYLNTDLDTLLKESDIITLHCPLNKVSRHIINKETLSKMKKSALLINTGRGGLVDEQALAEALNSGKIAGAATDVLSTEPPASDNPLLTAKNIIITPHCAWSTVQARQKLIDETVASIKAFIEGKPINVIS
ncbi:MAG: D-2-hydroxyacid dehydrogenase [Planctomycetota bacterium]|jgi:glycerate dehydrogenase